MIRAMIHSLTLTTILATLNTANAVEICNDNSTPCNRSYSETVFLTTHNSYNYQTADLNVILTKPLQPRGFFYPNQERSIKQQLKDGVRAFMLDLHSYNGAFTKHHGKTILCHGGKACDLLGWQFFSTVLKDYKEFLDQNPTEVVTFILESYVSVQKLSDDLEAAGLQQRLHEQNLNEPWPTLKEMAGKIVVINDTTDPDFKPKWNLSAYNPTDHQTPSATKETHYSVKKAKDFTCLKNRGTDDAPLFILNHFLTANVLRRLDARKVNHKNFIIKRANECGQIFNRVPNFVTVDFYRSGRQQARKAVHALNQTKGQYE